MRTALISLIFAAFFMIVFGISFIVIRRIGLVQTIYFDLYAGCIILFGIAGITYKRLWTKHSIKRNPAAIASLSVMGVVVCAFFFGITKKAVWLSDYMSTTKGKFMEGRVYRTDPVFGFVPIPCSSGFVNLEFKKQTIHKIPVKYDENGFRIPPSAPCTTEIKRPLVLFLGCSFTEGAYCNDEETFPYIVGVSLNYTSLNAGVSSYGFAQMLLAARKLIPKYKPDYIVFQRSPWLSQRAINRFAPVYILHTPTPHFAKVEDSIVILPPDYPSPCFQLDWEYDKSKNKAVNFISIFFRKGFAVAAKDTYHALFTRNRCKKKAVSIEIVEKAVFNEIMHLSQQNNSKLIVLNLGYTAKHPDNFHPRTHDIPLNFAEADSLLMEQIHFKGDDYQKAYLFLGWNGKDSVLIDGHPNPKAHSIIAESIVKAIKSIQ